MVIQHFNKLIRNKWVWGVFALLVSCAFCFDFLFSSRDERGRDDSAAASLGVPHDAALERDVRDMLRCFVGEEMRGNAAEETFLAAYAAIASFREAGLTVSDEELAADIRRNYLSKLGGDEAAYRQYLENALRLDVGRFEELRRLYLLLQQGTWVMQTVTVGAATMEVDQLVHNMTDRLSVKLATFKRTEKDDEVELTDEKLKEWYDGNEPAVTTPACVKLRYVQFRRADTNLVADAEITMDAITARYEEDKAGKYTQVDTNGVETVTALTAVSAQIEKTLRDEARQAKFDELRDSLLDRMLAANDAILYGDDPAKAEAAKSFLSEAAAEAKAEPATTEWLPAGPVAGLLPGLVASPSSVFRGANVTGQTLAAFDPAAFDERDAFALYESRDHATFWIVECIETKPSALSAFDDVKSLIEKPVRDELSLANFTNRVQSVVAGGAEAVVGGEDGTRTVEEIPAFSIADSKAAYDAITFSRPDDVIAAAAKLVKGGVSEMILSNDGRTACVVVCTERLSAPASASAEVANARQQATAMVMRQHGFMDPEFWRGKYLRSVGYREPGLTSTSAE